MHPHQVKLSHPKYRSDIDGLRALAVLAVVAFHAFPNSVKGGFIGVDIFFVISGYLISTIIFENLDKGTFSFSEFYARRIKRIFPALLLVLAACFVFGWLALLADELKQLGKHIAAGVGFVSNIVLWSEIGYFDNSAETKPLLHLWSLGVEEQFYLAWPLLLWFAWKQKFNLLTITILIAIVSFSLNIYAVKQDLQAAFYSPQTRFWELLSGSLVAWFALYKKDLCINIKVKIESFLTIVIYRDKQATGIKIFSNILSLIGLLILIYGFWRINKEARFPGKLALVPVFGTVLIIAAGTRAWINRVILSNKAAVWFGLISFPLYLWHWPLLTFARIVSNELPSPEVRVAAIILSIALAWITVKMIEKPFRFGNDKVGLKLTLLCSFAFVIGVCGFVVSKTDFASSRTYEKLFVKRAGFEHVFGTSDAWYKGKEDWLFLGNSYQQTVAKLKMAIVPTQIEISATQEIFSNMAAAGVASNTKIMLLVGPDKQSIYPENLPDELIPAPKKYINFFLDKLKSVPNLTVYNPTVDLLNLKKDEGLLYYMTDTHWNDKGAFWAYSSFLKFLELPIPQVKFRQAQSFSGDLLGISKLENFPLHKEDSWEILWENKPVWTESIIKDTPETVFGASSVVNNPKPLSNKYIWVIGDSFAVGLRAYINATFKEVRYVGHWDNEYKTLAAELMKAERKPDMVFIIKVERSF